METASVVWQNMSMINGLDRSGANFRWRHLAGIKYLDLTVEDGKVRSCPCGYGRAGAWIAEKIPVIAEQRKSYQ